jgi:hypothetical protein
MAKSWTDVALVIFPWIGCGGAIVLLVLQFGTRLLQSEPGSSRWHDRVWLSWLAVAIYLLHNVEEYGIDVFNIPLIWVIAPIAALLSRRHPLVGLKFYGVIFVNLFSTSCRSWRELALAAARLPQSLCSYRYRLGSSTPASVPVG